MRRLNKSVVAGGVVYPAGASGADVEAAISNPEHWDGYEPDFGGDISAEAGVAPEVLEKLAGQLQSLLVAVAPLIAPDVDADSVDVYAAVFHTEDGLEQLADKVAGLVATSSEDEKDNDQESTSPVDYSAMSREDLEAEVVKRNADGRDTEIEVGGRGNKPDLIAALVADDE